MGLEKDSKGRIFVSDRLQSFNYPNLFVLGDLAHVKNYPQPLPQVAPVALQQGEYLGQNFMRLCQGKFVPPFHYRDKGDLVTIGRSKAVARIGKFKLTGLLAWGLWLVVHLVYLIGFRNRLLVLIQWAFAYFAYQPSAQIVSVDRKP